ncbi:G5 domain-containing protein [Candidatus Berkelbacteria bacterium]|nr:G5 domain-containing protein [Candidatus Berkelbacteria bacterium]
MSFGRSHVSVLFLVLLPMVIGVFYGSRAGVQEALAQTPLPVPTTIDQRHPLEVFWAPPFVKTSEETLARLGVSVAPEDQVSLNPGFAFGIGGQLVITRALPVAVIDGREASTYRTWATTVNELLTEQGIELGDHDRIEPSRETVLGLGQQIMITRVAVVEVTKTESISFTTRTQDDASRPRGERTVTQKGVAGAKALTYRVTRENGVEVDRTLINTEVTKEAISEIVSVGTRVVVLGEGRATWYDPPWSGLTAAHNTLPKGTLVDVVNVKTGQRVTVKINDRGIQSDAVIDLSVEAFRAIASLGTGVIQVRLEVAG